MLSGPTLPSGWVTFCDDIRLEEGGKKSLMGIYTSEMIFSTQAPATLPNFCIVVNWRFSSADAGKPFELRIYRDGTEREELFKASMNLPDVPDDESYADAIEPEALSVATAVFDLRMPGLTFEEDCILRARILLDGDERRVGALRVRFLPSESDVAS